MGHEQLSREKSHLLLRLHLVAKIALIVGGVSFLAMVLALSFVTDKSGVGYGTIIRSFSMSRQHLTMALLIEGLCLVSFAGVFTWLVSLYAGFYIAGPLYRFARNIEDFIEQGPVTPVPTRQKDKLKYEEQQILRSIAKLQSHFGAMREAAETALAQIDAQQNPAAAIAQLKKLDRAARL